MYFYLFAWLSLNIAKSYHGNSCTSFLWFVLFLLFIYFQFPYLCTFICICRCFHICVYFTSICLTYFQLSLCFYIFIWICCRGISFCFRFMCISFCICSYGICICFHGVCICFHGICICFHGVCICFHGLTGSQVVVRRCKNKPLARCRTAPAPNTKYLKSLIKYFDNSNKY